MHEIQTISLALIVPIGLISLLLAALYRLVVVALSRVSRASAAEAVANGEVGKTVEKLLANRPAAELAANALRIIFISLFAIAVVVSLIGYIGEAWILLAVAVAVILSSFVLMSLILPTTLAIRHPLRIIGLTAPILLGLSKITRVFVARMVSVEEELAEDDDDDDRVALVVERVSEAAVVEDDERSLISSVFELGRTYIREVMVPRTDMITISSTHTLDQALTLFSRSGFSRVPIVGDSIDDLVGVLYLKDVIRRVHHRSGNERLPVTEVMREPNFVPETMLVDDLLHEMQTTSVHIALVVDEYGGIAGLVTIEDLLEELVGEMVDEHDRANPEVEDLGEGRYRVPSRLALDELGELFGVNLADDDVDTVAGLLAKTLGKVPILGSAVEVNGIYLEAERFEGRRKRISTILASRTTSEAEEEK